ncbi:Methyltransferase domain-containing protein [Desulfatibacillum alkenivorans DSM 16219]|jgi:2-polyprenyl-3-methyl-5-hydroxy-6-metoxy-1,4-benzoquinol methylase|uniref:Methyltransferase domain-containing protein n=1 Tax=Desulfatibacillum alkenivorans DSM 16219 TaxID=1121393 RepID=A0A1M6RYC8_9BACT|nr:class I SAM-dependent methyltransferase [Desulfatibacillum alkenivorans]SHK37299.1 Methyltransferase domain-containing protein [Desulfatibacillum alkenivorans DSM 16219]
MKETDKQSASTYDFVQQTGRDKYFAARDREIALLSDGAGGIKPEFAEPVEKCPVCGCGQSELWFKKQGFEFRRCKNTSVCGHIFGNPQINEDALNDCYRGAGEGGECAEVSANDLWIEVLLSQANASYDKGKYQRGIDAMQTALGTDKPGRVLDIGCSIGHFLALAKEAGWDAVGLELNEKAVAYATKELGLDVRPQLLDEAGFPPESFDVVTLWGVIEHLKRPVEVISQIAEILKPGGILLTFCPNGASMVCRVLREHAATFDGRNHPSYFTPQSIKYVMEQSGLENIAISFHQPDLDAVLNYLEGRDPYLRDEQEKGPLHAFFSGENRPKAEDFIRENGYGYKMMTLNRKPV